jgi:putative flavoprotein involved in K+ transport
MTVSGGMELIEEGAASMHLAGRPPSHAGSRSEAYDVIVIGGGQAGLSVGYHLARRGLRFVILDANKDVGDSWRSRWDSLRLFTPAKFNGLDGMPFPAPRNSFPTKDEMASYLEAYARRFSLPVRSGVRVQRLWMRGQRYVATAGDIEFESPQVVVAMAKYQRAKLPAFANELYDQIVQLHSKDYRNIRQLQRGGVLVVGAGNSGADIALEIARADRKVWLAGRDVGQLRFRPERFLGRNLLMPFVLGFVFRHLLTVNTKMGRKARPAALVNAVPLIRVKRKDLVAAGIERVPRIVGVRGGLPLLDDGRTLAVSNVIWSSGFHSDFDWIDLPIFSADGQPKHCSGVVESHPGLYFVGLPFLHSMSSSMVHGVGRDAARIVEAIKRR